MSDTQTEFQLRLPHRGPTAHGRLLDEKGTNGAQKFLVRAGSPVRSDVVPSFPTQMPSSYHLRKQLIADGLIRASTTRSGCLETTQDIICNNHDGVPLAVVDAKYKAEKPAGFPDADLYQMLAYCTALNLADGHLVYARGNAPHGSHRVKYAGITIHQHALELNQNPTKVLENIEKLAQRLAVTL